MHKTADYIHSHILYSAYMYWQLQTITRTYKLLLLIGLDKVVVVVGMGEGVLMGTKCLL